MHGENLNLANRILTVAIMTKHDARQSVTLPVKG